MFLAESLLKAISKEGDLFLDSEETGGSFKISVDSNNLLMIFVGTLPKIEGLKTENLALPIFFEVDSSGALASA